MFDLLSQMSIKDQEIRALRAERDGLIDTIQEEIRAALGDDAEIDMGNLTAVPAINALRAELAAAKAGGEEWGYAVSGRMLKQGFSDRGKAEGWRYTFAGDGKAKFVLKVRTVSAWRDAGEGEADG